MDVKAVAGPANAVIACVPVSGGRRANPSPASGDRGHRGKTVLVANAALRPYPASGTAMADSPEVSACASTQPQHRRATASSADLLKRKSTRLSVIAEGEL